MLTKQKGHFSWQTFECMNDKGQKMFDKQKHAAKKCRNAGDWEEIWRMVETGFFK